MRRISIIGGALTVAVVTAAAAQPRVISTAAVPAMPPLVRSGGMTPQTIVMRPMSLAETQANAIWSLRAGLNVAALQCQFSPYLATVRTYNDLLKHHSAELARAQATMIAHFKRYDKARALNSFDQYSTRIYNSYSTLDAQYAFCSAAAMNGRPALLLDKGSLGAYALAATPALRASLAPSPASAAPALERLAPVEVSTLTE